MRRRAFSAPGLTAWALGIVSIVACDPGGDLPDAVSGTDAWVSDASTADSGGTTPDAWSDLPTDAMTPLDAATLDAPPVLDAAAALDAFAGTDATLVEDAFAAPDVFAGTDAYVPPDAGPTCEFPAIRGGTQGGVTSEACTLLGAPVRATSSSGFAVTIANDGTVFAAHRTGAFSAAVIRFVPDAGSGGCVLRRDESFSLPGEWGPIDVAPSGSLFALSSASGRRSATWTAPAAGSCASMAAMGAEGPIDVGADGEIIARNLFGPPVVLATSSCTWSQRAEAWTATRGVTRIDADTVVAGSGIGCSLARFSGTTQVFCSTESLSANDLARCGDDVCVLQGGTANIARIAGATGVRVTDYSTMTLFDRDRPAAFDGSPDGRALIVGELTGSTTCAGTLQLSLWRVSGF